MPVPSIAESVASSLTANPDHNNGASLEDFIPQTETPSHEETAPAPEKPEAVKEQPKAEAKAEPAKPPKLTDAISDEDPEKPEAKKTEEPQDGPREGEKPAQFIKRIKQELADARNALKQAQERTAKQPNGDAEEAAKLRSEIEALQNELKISAYERSPEFKKSYEEPLKKAQEGAKTLISKLTDTKGVFERALALDGKDRIEYLTQELGDSGAALALVKLDAVDEATNARNAALSNQDEISRATLQQRESEETKQILAAFDAQRDSVHSRLSAFRSEHGSQYEDQARAILTGNASPEDIIAAARLAAVAPHYINQVKELRAENAALKARIAQEGADKPSINGRGSDGSRSSDNLIRDGKLPDVKSFLKRQLTGV